MKKSLKIPKGGNQNPYIEEEQTTQWPKEKVQKDKHWSTKHTYKTKDRVTRTPLKTGGELRCSGRVNSSCSTRGTHHINLVTNLVISHVYTENMLELFWQCCIFIVFHFISLELPIIQVFIPHLLWKEFIQNGDIKVLAIR